MNRWLLAAGLLMAAAWCAPAHAADNDAITVTVSLATETSVTLTPTGWNIGPISKGSINGPTSFTAKIGNTAVKLEIKASNAAGGWVLGTPAGVNRYEVDVNSPALILTTAYQTLAPTVTQYGSKTFGLIYKAPTGDTYGAGLDQSFSIIVKASTP